ncbi:hypothetical protein GLOTRDRAFT_94923 [Gloeophyllum trabeum ATCC 11539]|uniref:Cytochrome P450 n=1 Tax=Gloeophyllum trabeum (strain ATCC 11539 / FP-39264 / Madison 617) TaxID=670483 RepID=S7Q1D3_GLOTA|nr:uncharacterized protein GLOTRDRAFT_94923 [Gloeophyllum trabeum ATCC 11539]EPQ53766.1 hypothetical protein GLOTRDRAFT_94923 [Gloeophyllum trabeum ATCC 11539]
MRDVPYHETKDKFLKGEATPSVASALMQQVSEASDQQEAEILARNTAALGYTGGLHWHRYQIEAFTRTFFLAVANGPHVQRKAQQELDEVLGECRLPEFNDQPNLPYISAIIKEVQRWRVITPYGLWGTIPGFPHMSVSDDEYEGAYQEPLRSILHDPEVCPEPESFKPAAPDFSSGVISLRGSSATRKADQFECCVKPVLVRHSL